MEWFEQTRRPFGSNPARSLCWRGDELIDWVSGGDVWRADGAFISARRSWGYDRFDGAVTDPTGRWAVVYEATGTSALLLREGSLLRELHRSSYQASACLYPVELFTGPDGRTLLAHCPDNGRSLELEDAETGERLTRLASRAPCDLFHSRLAASPSGTRLLRAGWRWHPWNCVTWFDITAALNDPHLLDAPKGAPFSGQIDMAEECSAAWVDDDHLLLGASSEQEDEETVAEALVDIPCDSAAHRLQPNGLAVYDVAARRYLQSVVLGYPPGIMMPVGPRHVLTFFNHPRLVSLDAGAVVHEWTDLDPGEHTTSIVWKRPRPVIALDPKRARFAVATPTDVAVIALDLARLPR